jgi:two-component system sensor kinase FixL
VFERLKRGEHAVHYETKRLHKDGSEVQVSFTASLIRNQQGEVVGTSGILRDISEQRRTAERLQNLQDELVHLSRWNMMGMMASTIAHELNQPLTATINYMRAARRTITAEAANFERTVDFLDRAVNEAKLAGGIIRSLREFIGKRESGRNREDINVVVEESISLSLLGGHGRKVRARVELGPLLPLVLIDKIQIEQVLLNLIRNAVEAIGDQSDGELRIATHRDDPEFICVSVSDTGPGLAPEIAQQLFQPFVTTKDNGMGVGLTICQSIIEAHGGTIWSEPVVPQGVTFRFRLPAAKAAT